MRSLAWNPSARSARFAAVIVSAVAAGLVLGQGAAVAGPCGSAVAAGTSCSMTGTVTVSTGALTLQTSSSLTWSVVLNGSNQQVVDTVSGDQQYIVDDATGSGSGWHVTVSATTFTTGASTLANSGTFSTNGSVTAQSSTSAPTATCGSGSSCTLPTNTTSYPVAITTAAASPTAYTIYDTSASTGLGVIDIGGSAQADPVGWWVAVPGGATPGTYTSTITMEVVSAP